VVQQAYNLDKTLLKYNATFWRYYLKQKDTANVIPSHIAISKKIKIIAMLYY